MKQPNPSVKCQSCKGTGLAEMADSLAETLGRFKAKPLSAHDLYDPDAGVTINAMNNRLEKLRVAGFLSRNRIGRHWFYAKKGGAAQRKTQPKKAAGNPIPFL